jgi:ribosome-binding factor A
MREYGRGLRIADFIRDELAAIIQREMRDPRVGMVSVNEVKVSKDLSYAEVYVSSLDAETETARKDLIDVLNKASGFFRSELAKRHKMRTTPKPRFHYDELMERGPRIESLIERAVRADAVRSIGRDDDAGDASNDPENEGGQGG